MEVWFCGRYGKALGSVLGIPYARQLSMILLPSNAWHLRRI